MGKPDVSNSPSAGELCLPFSDEQIYVVEKPAGIHTVGEGTTLEALLKLRFPQLATLPDAGLVQRLDFETTGIIVGAFSAQLQANLRGSLSTGDFSKTYLVVAEGAVAEDAIVEGYLYSRYRSSARVSMQDKPLKRGQFSKSFIRPVQNFGECSLVRVDCSVARRHQVRVHMASLGHPLVGDSLYGAKKKLSDIGLGSHQSSFVLIAETVEFDHPVTNQTLRLSASLTAEKLLDSMQACGSTV